MIATACRPKTGVRFTSGRFLIFSGVFLPLAAILFEAATAVCADFIDPMPSWEYGILLLTVPACNGAAWLGLRRDAVQYSRLFAAMAGFSGAIALYYTILFLPIMPMAAIGIIVGLPILAFAPVLALWTAIKLIRAWAGFAGVRMVVLGAACGFAALVSLALPELELRAGASMVQSEHSWMRETGYRVVRSASVRSALQEACEPRTIGGARQSIALLSWRGPLDQQDARQLYYRAWGEPFDREPLPVHRAVPSWSVFDRHRGGDRVGPLVQGVRLSASRIDGSLDAGSATAYFEWTFVFHNNTVAQQEARMELALPPGAVVSRATLWIHGAEREAAFGERGQVRQAYENVVRMRRDPLLVTTAGRDRVLVQCFPVEPADDMKIRIGITAPIVPEGLSSSGTVTLPALLDRNFDPGDPATVWVESRSALAAWGAAEAKIREDGVYVLRGAFPEAFPEDRRGAIHMSGVQWESAWAPENAAGDRVIEQRFAERTIAPPQRAIVIVDGSESTRAIRKEIGAALASIPAGIETRVIVAARDGLADWASAPAFEGGVDAVPALEEAFRAAGDPRRTAFVWIAGEQPVRIATIETIRQTLERQGGRIQLSVLASGRENLVWRELDALPGVEALPRFESVGNDLSRFFARWREPETRRVPIRKVLPSSDLPKDVRRGSAHIVRLWAAEESARIAERDRTAAVTLAVAHQIVTPISGAVVLETAAQYQQSALQPASTATVPTMPEPETWGLLAVALLVVTFFAWNQRRRRLLI